MSVGVKVTKLCIVTNTQTFLTRATKISDVVYVAMPVVGQWCNI